MGLAGASVLGELVGPLRPRLGFELHGLVEQEVPPAGLVRPRRGLLEASLVKVDQRCEVGGPLRRPGPLQIVESALAVGALDPFPQLDAQLGAAPAQGVGQGLLVDQAESAAQRGGDLGLCSPAFQAFSRCSRATSDWPKARYPWPSAKYPGPSATGPSRTISWRISSSPGSAAAATG